jgi:cell division protein FtsB
MANRVVPALLIALLLIFHGQLWFGRGSLGNVAQMHSKLDALLAKNAAAKVSNNQLAAEVRDLKEGLEMVEEKARFELGMVKPNEVLVQITR